MQFLHWIYLRLKNKYHEDNDILKELEYIIKHYKLVTSSIDVGFIDRICKQHFVEFDMEQVPDLNFGFNEQDRSKYRNLVLDVVKEISKQ